MQTSNVNPLTALTNAASAAKGASVAPAVPFQQVLNREVNERAPQPEPQQAAPKSEAPPEPAKQNVARPADGKADSKAAKNNSVKQAEKKADAPKEDEAQADQPVDQASNELLALVANLNQPAVQPDAKDQPADQGPAVDAAAANLSQATLAMNTAAPLAKPSADRAELAAIEGGAKGRGKAVATDLELPRAVGKESAEPKLADGVALGATEQQPESRVALDAMLARGADVKPDAGAGFDAQAAKAQDALQALAGRLAAEKAPAATEVAMTPVQQAAAALMPANAAVDKLSPRVGTPAWDNALGQKIVWMVGGAEQTASLSLNPPDLGPLQVVLNVTNDQADATFIAAQPEVRQAIEAAMPKLREMMGEAGIQLGQANVSAQAQGQQQAAGDQQRQSQQRGNGGNGNANQAEAPAAPVRSQRIVSGQGVVDTFA